MGCGFAVEGEKSKSALNEMRAFLLQEFEVLPFVFGNISSSRRGLPGSLTQYEYGVIRSNIAIFIHVRSPTLVIGRLH